MDLTPREIESSVLWSQGRIVAMESAIETMLAIHSKLLDLLPPGDSDKYFMMNEVDKLRLELEESYYKRCVG